MERPSRQSSFKSALKSVPVPHVLMEGLEVLRVNANGVARRAFLTLSEDKFTLYVTATKRGGADFGSLFRWGLRSHHNEEMEEQRAIDIGAIDRIQRGQITQKFELAKKQRQPMARKKEDNDAVLAPSRSFSIIFRGERTLDLMTLPGVRRGEILDALDNVVRAYQASKQKAATDVLLLRYIWLDVDKDKTNCINVNELGRVLDRINFQMKRPQLNATYEKFGKTIGLDRSMRRKGLTFEQCCIFLHKIKRDTWMVKPVNVIWNELFGEIMKNGKPRTTVSDRTFLEKFLHKKQSERQTTIEDVQHIFARLHEFEIANVKDSGPPDLTRIDKSRFEAYLLGPHNDAFDPLKERFDARLMSKPLSEYWINSSHNTYLTGDQFTSHSSVEMYSNALYRGCRCLELDIWDGDFESDGRPIPVVWHGRTMTTKILFRDIIHTIKVFLNFHSDTYPIILSFENHCTFPFQQIMAEQLIEILGDRLYIPSEDSLFGRLPTPWELRGMVVIKGRRPNLDDNFDDTDDESSDEGISGISFQTDGEKSGQSHNSSSNQIHGVVPQLARLTLFHGTKHKNWDLSVRSPTHHMHSFSETKVRSLSRQGRSRKWAIYNQSHMTRTYPAGSRVDSSNYNPMMAWSTGCQMVALNFQTPDSALRMNDGRFRENGGCGYVLKPSSLMIKDDFFQTSAPLRLSIRILSGSCLPKPKGEKTGDCTSPYVKVSVFDVKDEEKDTNITFATSPAQANGFFPIWNQEKFTCTVENWAVAMLQLTVYDNVNGVGAKDEFIASASIPISCLRRGIRSVKIYDANNTRSGAFDFASLLIEVKMTQIVNKI